jgi:DNA-binding beta-propeller fold protein YncE
MTTAAVENLVPPTPKPGLELSCVVGRLVPCAVLLYGLRESVIDLVEHYDALGTVTEFVIETASTPLSRMLLALVSAAGFYVIRGLAARIAAGVSGYLIALLAASAATYVAARVLDAATELPLYVAVVLAFNWAPTSLLTRAGLNAQRLQRLILVPPGVAEALFTGHYVSWIHSRWSGRAAVFPETALQAPSVVVAAIVLATLAPAEHLVPIETALRGSPHLRMFATGDFNGLIYDATLDRVFATGHGTDRVLAYSASALAAPPLEASVESGEAQSLDFDPSRAELYVHSAPENAIQVFDTTTLTLKRRIPAAVAPGDSWIAHDPITDRLLIASEADAEGGWPLLVLDRDTGAVVDERSEEAGNLLVRPGAPIVYLSFFRRTNGLSAYDIQKNTIVAQTRTVARMERMAYDAKHVELLVTAPTEGRIYRVDPDTLAFKGSFRAVFGVRVVAIDELNDCLLAGSLANGRVVKLGLTDHEVKDSWYVGPWLRSIALAPSRGVAYISSESALYELRYLRGDASLSLRGDRGPRTDVILQPHDRRGGAGP